MRGRRASPPTPSLLHAVLVDERRPLELDADEHPARRCPREGHLLGVEGVAGEELRVLLAERGGGSGDRGRPRHGISPRAAIEGVVELGRAGERDRQLAVADEAGRGGVRPPGPRLHRTPGGRQPQPAAGIREDQRRAVRAARRGRGRVAELTLLQHGLDRGGKEAHGVTFARSESGGHASISPVHTRWLTSGERSPPVHTANPVQSAPPTMAPASSGALAQAAITPTAAAHVRSAPVVEEVASCSWGRTRPRQNSSSPGTAISEREDGHRQRAHFLLAPIHGGHRSPDDVVIASPGRRPPESPRTRRAPTPRRPPRPSPRSSSSSRRDRRRRATPTPSAANVVATASQKGSMSRATRRNTTNCARIPTRTTTSAISPASRVRPACRGSAS